MGGLIQSVLAQSAFDTWRNLAYIVAAVLFISGLKKLSSPRTARTGNGLAALGMLVAVLATMLHLQALSYVWILIALVIGSGIGVVLAARVQMTQMPQLVALYNGSGGVASALVAIAEYSRAGSLLSADALFIVGLGTLIGCVTFSGSIVAAGKLHGKISGKPVILPNQMLINAALIVVALLLSIVLMQYPGAWWTIPIIIIGSLALGVTLTMPIGGADMPVMVSLLNSYSGLAASAAGFIIGNLALIVSGALVGASGLILTAIMCKAMNRSLGNVLFAGVGTADSAGTGGRESTFGGTVKSADPEDVAIILDSAQRVMIVPGYGLAVAQAQHIVKELAGKLEARGIAVMYGVHPVAGRMPGHMNVLLAEADVPYEQLLEIEPANAEIDRCDAALVIGANDVVNPATRHDKNSPIYGMPIIDVDKARTVFVLKRSMAAGYAGVDNELFVLDNTLMVFGDAKDTLQKINTALDEL
ncbi:MAG: NAD(P)(+) transhydrogenase (Re/Si-specific) subunit beta [Phycisphaeraceae bacterium]|nr:NAD(P)(+) transhydrogenase (Re/Si-specific) subunit beta [Phycisphaeraceae bacterium]